MKCQKRQFQLTAETSIHIFICIKELWLRKQKSGSYLRFMQPAKLFLLQLEQMLSLPESNQCQGSLKKDVYYLLCFCLRPKEEHLSMNYLSCCSCIFHLIYAYQLQPLCDPYIYLPMSTYLHQFTHLYQSLHNPQRPGIGLVFYNFTLSKCNFKPTFFQL